MEATSREVEQFSSVRDTRGAKLYHSTLLCTATHCHARNKQPCTNMNTKEYKEVISNCTMPGMEDQAPNELSSRLEINMNSGNKKLEDLMTSNMQPCYNHKNSSCLLATSLLHLKNFCSEQHKPLESDRNEGRKQERFCSDMKMLSRTLKTKREFRDKHTKTSYGKPEDNSAFLGEIYERKYYGKSRSLTNFTLIRLLLMIAFLPWNDAAGKSSTRQPSQFPSSRAYLHLTLLPPAQTHKPPDSLNFTQMPVHPSQATPVTESSTSKSATFRSESGGSTADGIGRSLGDQRPHFLVNDINVDHDDSSASVNEVHGGDVNEGRHDTEIQQRLRKEREAAAHKWAPVVWLHPKEIFFPGDVLDFLDNVNISSSEGIDIAKYNSDAGLPQGSVSEDLYLVAPIDTECFNCPMPGFLHGQRPIRGEGPPVYAHIHTCYSPIPITTASPTMSLLLRMPPDGTPLKPRSLRAQIRSLQHPLPRYRRRRPRAKGRGRRAATYGPGGASSDVNSTEAIAREEKKFVLTEDRTSEQNLNFREEYVKETERKIQESTQVSTSTFATTLINLSHPATELTYAEETIAALTPAQATSDIPHSSSKPNEDEIYSHNSSYANANITHSTEPTQTVAHERPKIIQSQGNLMSTQTSQPIIIIGNYSRMRHVYATAFPSLLQVPRLKNSTGSTITSPQRPNEDTQYGNANRRNAIPSTGSPGHHFTITYWFFYPYNHGKEVCTANMIFIGRVAKPLYKGECLGETVVMGNHVGDWEHLSIYFEDGEPRSLYLSAHHFGAFYTFQPEWHRFKYASQDVREGLHMSPQYPQYLELQQGRLVVYSARGSHGTWPSHGRHLYNNVMVKLEDETGQGHLWDTRHKVHIIDALEEKRKGITDTHRKWFDFRGNWGNPSSNCHPGLLGFCEIGDGPLGITMKRLNFPCNIPRHNAFLKP